MEFSPVAPEKVSRWLETPLTRSRLQKTLTWTLVAIAAFGIFGFFGLPPIVKPRIERALSTALQRDVRIDALAINPFMLTVTLRGIRIGEAVRSEPTFGLDELYVNAQASSLFQLAPVVSEVKILRPTLHLVRHADNTYNVSDILERLLAGPGGPPPRFSMSNIQIIDGRIDFDDLPAHRQHHVTDLRLGIPFLSTLPSNAEIKVRPVFSAVVNGRPVAIVAESRPFKDTHETLLTWDVSGLQLPTYMAYVPVSLPMKVSSGALDSRAELSFIAQTNGPPQLKLSGSAHISALVLTDNSGGPLLRIPSLAVSLDALEPLAARAEIRSIAVDGPQLDMVRSQGGEWNVALSTTKAASSSDSEPFQLHVRRIELRHGTVRFTDQGVAPAFRSTLGDVAIDIDDLATAANRKATVTASFNIDGGARFSERGTLALTPLGGDGHIEIAGLLLKPLYPYYAGTLAAAIDDGSLDVATDWSFAPREATTPAVALSNLNATLSSFAMRAPGDKRSPWRLGSFSVRDASLDIDKRTMAAGAIEARGGAAALRRDKNGAFNFERLMHSGTATPASGSDEPWRIEVRKATLDDMALTFVDESVVPPVRVVVNRAAATAENLSNIASAKARVNIRAAINKTGTIALGGTLVPQPFAASLKMAASGIGLAPFQPYIARTVRLLVTGGAASAKGALELAAARGWHGGFKGEMAISQLTALDENNNTDLLKWGSLAFSDVDAQIDPLSVAIGGVTLNDFFARLILNENGEFNLQQLARARAVASGEDASAAQPSEQPTSATGAKERTTTHRTTTAELAPSSTAANTWLKLGKTTLAGGEIDFTDHFIRPNYSASLSGLGGTLSTLAFDQPAELEMSGTVQGSAPIHIQGRINPLAQDLFLDLKAQAKEVELSPLSPYSGKYVGYGIEKGKLSVDVRYLIENRKLTAENNIVLNQLTFGGKVDSPDATKLPVLLAVALLKDRNGVIDLNLPVGGSLDDPEFSVGGLVVRAIVNLLVKVATSPFTLLASLTGHGEEAAYVEFTPGSAMLDTSGEGKLGSIAKALNARPQLQLDIAGRIDPGRDREGLKRAALERKLKQQKFVELVGSGEPPPSVDDLIIEAGDRQSLLKRVYAAEKFPKPRNAIGLAKDLPPAEMEPLILANTAVSDEDLRELAERRARSVRAYLVDQAKIANERVFLVASKLDAEGIKDKGAPTRVDFSLH